MLNRFLMATLLALVLGNAGCKTEKKVLDEIEDLKKRVAALEKMLIPGKEEPPVQASAYEIPLENSPVLGDPNANVHIVVFSNFQCPYCAKADKNLRDIVLNDNELKGKVNLVFKHFPFERHPEARPAAKAALAAHEQNKFWQMAEKIFTHQDKMNEASYHKWAQEIGLDVAKFKKDLKDNDQKYNEIIDRDITVGAEKAKLEGTPWILVNGWLLEGEVSAATIKKMIADKKL